MDLDFDGASQNTGYVLNDSLVALNKAWSTETNALEILPYKNEIVQELQEQLEGQQDNIDQKIEDGKEEEYFVVTLYQMDIERVRYSLARYLRTRLLKIERSLEYILSNIDVMDRLSMQEKEFATKLNNLNTSYFEDNVTNRLQQSDAKDYYESSDNRLQHAKPAEKVRPCLRMHHSPTSHDLTPFFSFLFFYLLQHFVFCRAGVDISNLQLSSETSVTMTKGDINIVQYSLVKDYVASGHVDLL